MSFIEQQLATTTIVAFFGDVKPPTASINIKFVLVMRAIGKGRLFVA